MEKGKIFFCSYDEVDNLNLDDYKIKIQIVRSIKKGLKNDFKQVKGLSPSEKLLMKTMNKWKHLKFTKEELEEMKKGFNGTWWDLYEKRFIEEKINNKDFKVAYERLKYYLDRGTNIVAICYCEDFNKCHRSIISNMLKEEGYDVILK